MNKKLVQFDVTPQQTMLGNFQTGMQIVATINIEDLIDGITLRGKDEMAYVIGNEVIDLLKTNGSLIDAICSHKHINNVGHHIVNEIEQKDYEK